MAALGDSISENSVAALNVATQATLTFDEACDLLVRKGTQPYQRDKAYHSFIDLWAIGSLTETQRGVVKNFFRRALKNDDIRSGVRRRAVWMDELGPLVEESAD